MENFLTGVYIGLYFIEFVLIIFGPIVLVYFLAKNNIFFTIVKEGQAKAILKFGEFERIIMRYQGYGLDQEWKVCEIAKCENPESELISEPARIGGLMWVGIPFIHSVYKYEFRWVSFEQTEEGGRLIEKPISHPEENIDYIIVQDDIFYTFLSGAESKELLPINMQLLLTIRIVNPYKALFRVQNWLEAVQNQTKPALRGFASKKTYAQLIGKKEEVERESDKFLQDSRIDEYLEKNYGARLKRVGMVSIDLSGERGKAYLESSTKQYEADREKERILTIADAEVERINRTYAAIKGHGDEGLFIRTNEAIEEAGRGPSNLVLFPLGPINSMLEAWTGKKKEE